MKKIILASVLALSLTAFSQTEEIEPLSTPADASHGDGAIQRQKQTAEVATPKERTKKKAQVKKNKKKHGKKHAKSKSKKNKKSSHKKS
jgi:outer membrane biosynthesis protein TonB